MAQVTASCPPKTCGNMTISDPFWLVQEQGTERACGLIDYQVYCYKNSPFLRSTIHDGFGILNIFYENNTFLTADINKMEDFNRCQVPITNTSFKIGFLPFNISRANRDLLFFYDCTDNSVVPQLKHGLIPMQCGNNSFVHLEQGPYSGSHDYAEYFVDGCKATLVPVLGSSTTRINASDYKQLISDGFLLSWPVIQVRQTLLMNPILWGFFQPVEQDARFEENTETMQEEETMLDDDEECRIFSGLGDVFDSYRVTTDVPQSEQNDDPYDFVYHNLPKKHHVLKTVPDCIHCGAMKLQYEGPAFCCRKGKVKIATPEVPQELRRLFTSQVDADAKYFRKHIRYFNTHFSFTSLGVTLDKTVSSAARTGVYTFRAQGALYYKMDDLVPGDKGPRHLQLYFYDTDETLEHRLKRSPDLDINIIRAILEILKDNPYVKTTWFGSAKN
ncbi:hypothetical protein ACQ4PT_040133 [Festuca glaucescens]